MINTINETFEKSGLLDKIIIYFKNHIVLGMTPEGQKAVLGYEIVPNENNASWSTLLDKLQNQGIQQFSLVVTDGLSGLSVSLTH